MSNVDLITSPALAAHAERIVAAIRNFAPGADVNVRLARPNGGTGAGDEAATQAAWESYWSGGGHEGKWLYDAIASFYRRAIIRPAVNHFLGRTFAPGARVLHAGCGSGAVDVDASRRVRITALDISPLGLAEYARIHGEGTTLMLGSIFAIPAEDGSFDGVFNLGVMEHYWPADIGKILAEFNRVLKPGGHVVLYWPPAWGLSVIVLKMVHGALKRIGRGDIQLHPPEVTHVRSRAETRGWMEAAGFSMETFYFGPRDFFTHQIVVGRKHGRAPS
ncbi:MAG: class I SAM-dependent methyltransferase [Rhodospirillales bacterium]|nr:class I SAM-dependent methyltransferase [Rhodospirillales bacterium]